jgi:hypothetical protein
VGSQVLTLSGGATVLGRATSSSSTVPSPTSCTAHGASTLSAPATIVQQWACESPQGPTVYVTSSDAFISAPTSVRINTTISPATFAAGALATTSPFTTALSTPITFAASTFSSVWTSWGKGCVNNNGATHGMCFAGGLWSEPFTPESLLPTTSARYRYGATVGATDSFTLPLVTLLDDDHDVAVSLALNPDDPLLELGLETTANSTRFNRELLRLGHRPVSFSAHIIGHAACWRPALLWFTRAYPPYFESWAPDAADYEGLGSYRWAPPRTPHPLNRQTSSRLLSIPLGDMPLFTAAGTRIPTTQRVQTHLGLQRIGTCRERGCHTTVSLQSVLQYPHGHHRHSTHCISTKVMGCAVTRLSGGCTFRSFPALPRKLAQLGPDQWRVGTVQCDVRYDGCVLPEYTEAWVSLVVVFR